VKEKRNHSIINQHTVNSKNNYYKSVYPYFSKWLKPVYAPKKTFHYFRTTWYEKAQRVPADPTHRSELGGWKTGKGSEHDNYRVFTDPKTLFPIIEQTTFDIPLLDKIK